jgi:Holliday junction resolvase RusA-like endonuclease
MTRPEEAIEISLPTPPSLNNLYFNVPKQGRVKSKRYTAWQWEATAAIHQQRPEKITGHYTARLRVPMRGDADNRAKPVLDILCALGITPDDRFCMSLSVTKEPRKDVLVVLAPAYVERTQPNP